MFCVYDFYLFKVLPYKVLNTNAKFTVYFKVSCIYLVSFKKLVIVVNSLITLRLVNFLLYVRRFSANLNFLKVW